MSAVFLVANAIKARLEGDTGAGGLFQTGSPILTSLRFTNGTITTRTYPYAVITCEADKSAAMGHDGWKVRWTITVYDASNQGEERLWPAARRINGPGTESPSYGLFRHVLTLDTDSTRNPQGLKGSDVVIDTEGFGTTENDGECIAYSITGEVTVST